MKGREWFTVRFASSRMKQISLGIAAVILLIIVGLSHREWLQYHRINAAAAETRDVVDTIDRIRSGMLAAETSERGFLLTGEERYLDPYYRVGQSMPGRLAQLKQLMAGRPDGPAQTAQLSGLVDRKFAEMADTIALRRSRGAAPALGEVLSDRGRVLMEEIRGLCSTMQRSETEAHSAAEADRETAARTTLLVTIVGSLLLIFLFVAGFEPVTSRESKAKQPHRVLTYGVALAAVIVATLLRNALTPLIGEGRIPFITYFPAVLFAAWYGGFGAGAFCVALSTLASLYFISPARSLLLANPGDLIGLLLFIFVSFGIVLLSDSQRKAVAERRRAEERLAGLNTDLQKLNGSLARTNEELTGFAFVTSHDLQEPLRMINTYAELLIKKYPAERGTDVSMFVETIAEGTRRMQRMLADLLAYAEIGAPEEERVEPIPLSRVIDGVRQNLKAAIEESGAVITYEDLPDVYVAESHLIPLFQNLISNAIKYRSAELPRIRISARPEAGHFRFAVADNGIGIEPEYHRKIFGVFKRLHTGKIPGTGIGLAICQRVVERYGGRIWVESQAGKGSTFCFTLPAVESRGAALTTGMARA